MSENIIDARGLSCPQPVILATQAMKNITEGQIEILTDCGVSPENVGRAANKNGWKVLSLTENNGEAKLVLTKQA